MLIKYDLQQNFKLTLKREKNITKLNSDVEWLKGELVFEDGNKSTKGLNINPDIPLLWSGFVLSGLSESDSFNDDIMGTMYYISHKGNNFQIYKKTEKGKHMIFSACISRNDLIICIRDFEKDLIKELIEINPLVWSTEIIKNIKD